MITATFLLEIEMSPILSKKFHRRLFEALRFEMIDSPPKDFGYTYGGQRRKGSFCDFFYMSVSFVLPVPGVWCLWYLFCCSYYARA